MGIPYEHSDVQPEQEEQLTNIDTEAVTNNAVKLVLTILNNNKVGILDGEEDPVTTEKKLYVNAGDERTRGIAITDDGTISKVGIGVTNPTEELEVNGDVQIDVDTTGSLKFKNTGTSPNIITEGESPHDLAEIVSGVDGTNGGYLQIKCKANAGQMAEVLKINNVGAFRVGSSGTAANFGNIGDVMISNGVNASIDWRPKYHLKMNVGQYNMNGAFRFAHNTHVPIDTWSVDTSQSPNTLYNGDIVNNTEWRPSNSGIYLINMYLHVRSLNIDRLLETMVRMEKWNGSSWDVVLESNDRRHISTNEVDARTYTHPTGIDTTINVSSGDRYRWTIFAVTSDAQNAYILTGLDQHTRWTITRLELTESTGLILIP
jgi:hypothetical protein